MCIRDSYLNDKKEGKWTEWNKEGSLVTSGTYHNSVKWSGIFDDGRYYKGRMANQSEQYYDNGTMKSQGMLIGEIKLDLWAYWYDNGNKKEEGSYLEDRKDGQWSTWYLSLIHI